MWKVTEKQAKALNEYKLKGLLLKPLPELVLPLLEGECGGLVAEITEDESVLVHKLTLKSDKTSVKPFLSVKDGVAESVSGRAVSVVPAKPEGKSVGVFISKTCKIFVPIKF